MAVHVDLKWRRPISLSDGWDDGLIYVCDLERLGTDPGVYVFCRRWGQNMVPVYIGKASNVQRRIKKQLNNLKLMRALQDSSRGGDRVLLHGYTKGRPGQTSDRAIDVAERALIERALADGHSIVNVQGTKRKTDELICQGNRDATRVFGKHMLVSSPRRR